MEQELAYSFHLGSDKNKSKLAKRVSKGNVSGTTSFSNNAIQNAKDLSKANKHNLRDYDNQKELITTIYGTNDIVEDVKQVYLNEFEQARIEYNSKTRADRQIIDYFQKVCDSQNDIACEIIIELGDMDFWQDKDNEYRYKMTDVYNEQIQELSKLLPTFKVANATIHYDETSPHMHIIGVPVIENCKRGMKKQVGKSQLFTKTLLSEIQDKMRNACIRSYNKFYDVDSRLKTKQKGRNQDINVNEMGNYREMKKKLEKQKSKLENANKQTKKLDNSSKGIIELLDNLKPMPFNKNNSQISNENIENIKDYIKDVTDVTQTVRSVNDLNMSIKDFEHATSKIENENYSLKEQIKLKDDDIKELKDKLSAKDKTIIKLNSALEKAKTELSKFKGFWKSLIKRFQMKIFDEKYYDIPEDKRSYTLVAEDLEKSGIFDNNDSDIVHNPTRKVLTNEELTEIQSKKGKKKNDYNLN
ncbi:MAG: plasmid recombination protein [Clostridia bacterium]|nr:plasmid recombination protein [Clostridia bacterium]